MRAGVVTGVAYPLWTPLIIIIIISCKTSTAEQCTNHYLNPQVDRNTYYASVHLIRGFPMLHLSVRGHRHHSRTSLPQHLSDLHAMLLTHYYFVFHIFTSSSTILVFQVRISNSTNVVLTHFRITDFALKSPSIALLTTKP